MRSIFCTNCGAKLQYSSAKPKFCSSCGEPLSASAESRSHTKAPPRKIIEDDGETDATEVPSIGSLDYDIEMSHENNIFNLGDILNEREQKE